MGSTFPFLAAVMKFWSAAATAGLESPPGRPLIPPGALARCASKRIAIICEEADDGSSVVDEGAGLVDGEERPIVAAGARIGGCITVDDGNDSETRCVKESGGRVNHAGLGVSVES